MTRHPHSTVRRFFKSRRLAKVLAALALLASSLLVAQEEASVADSPPPVSTPPEERIQAGSDTLTDTSAAPPEPAEFPERAQLVEGLVDWRIRHETLLTLATLLTLENLPAADSAEQAERHVRTLLGNRDWLVSLTRQYGYADPRSPVMDPAAWQVQLQLDRSGLDTTAGASPLGPGQALLQRQVFDRSDAGLAASTLPELLWFLEVNGTLQWEGILNRMGSDPWLSVELYRQAPAWFAWPEPVELTEAGGSDAQPTQIAPVSLYLLGGEEAETDPQDLLLAEAMDSIGIMISTVVGVGPPDVARLASLRRSLSLALPELDPARRAHAAGLLHLAGVIDGLHRRHYYHFTESLLAVAAQIQQQSELFPEQTQWFSSWVSQWLPDIAASYGRAFSAVDPRLNSVIATTYDLTRTLSREVLPGEHLLLREQIGDAVAQLSLMIPDMGFYFDQPVRDTIAGGVEACAGIAARTEEDGTPSLTRDLFDDCQESLVELANFEAREAQLAGDAGGPFGMAQLLREFNLTAGQRINYGIGYLNDRYSNGCSLPERPLPNPLEWAYLATFMTWFAEQSPVFFQVPENEVRLTRMRDLGRELMNGIAEQVDCMSGSGGSMNDPVDRITSEYAEDLRSLSRDLSLQRAQFRSLALEPGADVSLDGEGDQMTSYRPADLTIGPCDPTLTCEMSDALSSTRALAGLFSETFLVADQTRLGELEICYDNLGWVDRRLEPVRAGDENVANYYGRLSFDLKGRFADSTGPYDLFGFRFETPEEYHYLFAAYSDEVLEDPCPVEWVGTRIVTELPDKRGGIIPNRLTYLSAARTLPSRLLKSNWDQGSEWRDWFVTGLGVEALPVADPPDLVPRLDRHLDSLYRREQNHLHTALADASGPGSSDAGELGMSMNRLVTRKMLLRTQMMLFFPHILTHSDPLREAIAGQKGLLDRSITARARQENVPVDVMMNEALDRLARFQQQWQSLPEGVRRRGSVADSVSHALVRLNAIHERYFSAPALATDGSLTGLSGSDGQSGEKYQTHDEMQAGDSSLGRNGPPLHEAEHGGP